MKYKKITISLFMITILLIMQFSVICLPANAKPTKPTLKDDPMHGQILPFYEVWLRWNDVSNEAYYSMTVRDLGYEGRLDDDGPLIYNKQQVAQNSTYFIIPTSKLIRGHHYRWCLRAHDSSGAATLADAQVFAIEDYNPDRHLKTDKDTNVPIVPRTRTMEYFVYAPSTGYDPILNQAAQNWNGHANVTLVRTATPTDGKYEIGIYESPSPADSTILGTTKVNAGNTRVIYDEISYIFEYAEVQTFKGNIDKYYNTTDYYIKTKEGYYLANAMHEVGHALLLNHTWNDTDYKYPYDISKTILKYGFRHVPLIMNSGYELGGSLNVVDRDHLRLKWGT